jgi:CBS domain containing-hemolysin-like protein
LVYNGKTVPEHFLQTRKSNRHISEVTVGKVVFLLDIKKTIITQIFPPITNQMIYIPEEITCHKLLEETAPERQKVIVVTDTQLGNQLDFHCKPPSII